MQELSYGRGSIELLRGPWRLTSPIVRLSYSDTSKIDRFTIVVVTIRVGLFKLSARVRGVSNQNRVNIYNLRAMVQYIEMSA